MSACTHAFAGTIRTDRALWWSITPAIALLLGGLVSASPWAITAGAVALPIALAAAVVTAIGWRSSVASALKGALVSLLVRFAGLIGCGFVLALLQSAHRLTVTAAVAICLVAGLLIDAVIRSYSLPTKDPARA